MRLSLPGTRNGGKPIAVPNYGFQLQDRALNGVEHEGKFEVRYIEAPGVFADGEPYTLLKPEYVISDLSFGE